MPQSHPPLPVRPRTACYGQGVKSGQIKDVGMFMAQVPAYTGRLAMTTRALMRPSMHAFPNCFARTSVACIVAPSRLPPRDSISLRNGVP